MTSFLLGREMMSSCTLGMLHQYNGYHGSSILFFFLFQIGGCFIQVILYKISATGTRSSGRSKKEVAVFSIQ